MASHDSLAWRKPSADFETLAITESFDPTQFKSRAVVTPIVTSSIFMMDDAVTAGRGNGTHRGDGSKIYEYGRWGNPTRDQLEHLLAALDGAKHCMTFGSGSAAICALAYTLQSGDHVVSTSAIYGGSYKLYEEFERFGVSASFVVEHESVDEFLRLIRPNTKLIALESPANPTMTLVDIPKLVREVRALSRARGWPDIVIAVDNTFCTPVFQRPLELGADVAMYSCSKYLGGHGDIIMGAVTCNSDELYDKIYKSQYGLGGVPSPYDCYNLIRSLKTLPIRMRQHAKNAYAVALFLEGHPQVERALYPGLKSHPQHALALSLQFGGSGMVGFYIRGGFGAAKAFLEAVKVFQRAPSLGADVSLASIPGEMSHSSMAAEVKEKLKITRNFIRLSVGLESSEKQLADLKQALEAARVVAKAGNEQ